MEKPPTYDPIPLAMLMVVGDHMAELLDELMTNGSALATCWRSLRKDDDE